MFVAGSNSSMTSVSPPATRMRPSGSSSPVARMRLSFIKGALVAFPVAGSTMSTVRCEEPSVPPTTRTRPSAIVTAVPPWRARCSLPDIVTKELVEGL